MSQSEASKEEKRTPTRRRPIQGIWVFTQEGRSGRAGLYTSTSPARKGTVHRIVDIVTATTGKGFPQSEPQSPPPRQLNHWRARYDRVASRKEHHREEPPSSDLRYRSGDTSSTRSIASAPTPPMRPRGIANRTGERPCHRWSLHLHTRLPPLLLELYPTSGNSEVPATMVLG
jgi:hypothetical protein